MCICLYLYLFIYLYICFSVFLRTPLLLSSLPGYVYFTTVLFIYIFKYMCIYILDFFYLYYVNTCFLVIYMLCFVLLFSLFASVLRHFLFIQVVDLLSSFPRFVAAMLQNFLRHFDINI